MPFAALVSMPLMIAVAVAAAHQHRIGLTRQIDVVGVAALALHQDRVLGAPHRLADAVLVQIEGARSGLARS